jgi:hypothetical protein
MPNIGNAIPSEAAAVVATVDPDAYAAGAQSSDEIDMSKFESIMAVVTVGTMGAGGLLDCKLQAATTSGGSFVDVTGKAITQISQATSPLTSDVQAVINLRAEELWSTTSPEAEYRYVKVVMTVASVSPLASIDAGVVVFGFNPRQGPASDNDLASVAEIIS